MLFYPNMTCKNECITDINKVKLLVKNAVASIIDTQLKKHHRPYEQEPAPRRAIKH